MSSRNPYLAATRPTSSFTRSSRTSKRNEGQSSSSSLSRSRSSAGLSGSSLSSQMGMSSYTSASGYTPSWQRSASSTRLNRLATDPSSTSLSYRAIDYTPSNQYQSNEKSTKTIRKPLIRKSTSTHSISSSVADKEVDESENSEPLNHLKNYQQNKLQQPNPTLRSRSSVQSLDSQDSETSKTSVDLSNTDLSCNDSESVTSGSALRYHKPGHLLKSRSLDTNQQPSQDQPSSVLTTSMSVDRLLLRCESLSERELRKSYKELVMENENLKRQMKLFDDREKQKQQEWIRKERQMQRKISELEEENRQLEEWKQEIQHLKDENSSLIRVVTKLSKKH